MTEVVWSTNKTFEDSRGNLIQVLQRSLPSLEEAKNEELLPFFHEPSLFQTNSCAPGSLNRIAGVLTVLEFDNSTLRLMLCIRNLDSGDIINWAIHSIQESKMTVWRVNNVLDTIQINIDGEGEKRIYMQTGGSAISQIFTSDLAQSRPKEDIIDAERIFAENAVF